jgi:D-glycero-alpha-D-manno-heptose-7-phosphate kinase
MIIARCPLRISLGGGGTDLKSYYSQREGFLVAGAINKYVYVAIHRTFEDEIIAKYSDYEKTNSFRNLKHPIIRTVLELYANDLNNLEITSFADIPGGTGLGSSSAFTNSLIKAIFATKVDDISNEKLAESSCYVEIEKLKEPIGKQDQFITALGGLRALTFKKDGSVKNKMIYKNIEDFDEFSSNLVMVFTGSTRSASKILSDQKIKSEAMDSEMLENLDKTKALGKLSLKLLQDKDFNEYGKVMHEHWVNKKKRSPGMTSKKIDELYEYGINSGANGGKVIGAGGGGFILFQTEDRNKLIKRLRKSNLRVVNFSFVNQGTEIINI